MILLILSSSHVLQVFWVSSPWFPWPISRWSGIWQWWRAQKDTSELRTRLFMPTFRTCGQFLRASCENYIDFQVWNSETRWASRCGIRWIYATFRWKSEQLFQFYYHFFSLQVFPGKVNQGKVYLEIGKANVKVAGRYRCEVRTLDKEIHSGNLIIYRTSLIDFLKTNPCFQSLQCSTFLLLSESQKCWMQDLRMLSVPSERDCMENEWYSNAQFLETRSRWYAGRETENHSVGGTTR